MSVIDGTKCNILGKCHTAHLLPFQPTMGEASFDTLGQLELRGKKESGGEKGRGVGELGLGHEHTSGQRHWESQLLLSPRCFKAVERTLSQSPSICRSDLSEPAPLPLR